MIGQAMNKDNPSPRKSAVELVIHQLQMGIFQKENFNCEISVVASPTGPLITSLLSEMEYQSRVRALHEKLNWGELRHRSYHLPLLSPPQYQLLSTSMKTATSGCPTEPSESPSHDLAYHQLPLL